MAEVHWYYLFIGYYMTGLATLLGIATLGGFLGGFVFKELIRLPACILKPLENVSLWCGMAGFVAMIVGMIVMPLGAMWAVGP